LKDDGAFCTDSSLLVLLNKIFIEVQAEPGKASALQLFVKCSAATLSGIDPEERIPVIGVPSSA
jgi:hypothetical protein